MENSKLNKVTYSTIKGEKTKLTNRNNGEQNETKKKEKQQQQQRKENNPHSSLCFLFQPNLYINRLKQFINMIYG